MMVSSRFAFLELEMKTLNKAVGIIYLLILKRSLLSQFKVQLVKNQ